MRTRARAVVAVLVMLAGVCLGGWVVDGAPSTWIGVPAAAEVDEYTYPVLVLPLGGQWTDFELKASTNNFASLAYWIKSSGPSRADIDDTNVWIYFTDDYAYDVRKWVKSAAETAIGAQVTDPVNSEVEYAVVCPSHETGTDWRGWMSRENTRLVWSFVRYDGIGFETNATGSQTHWSPVVPVEWRRERVEP